MIASASELYCRAAKRAPTTDTMVNNDSNCAMCGTPLVAGDRATRVTKQTFDASFNNKADLRAPGSKYLCGHCVTLWSGEWMQRHSRTFATEDNVYKFASNEQQAAFLLNPPSPPFCAIFNTRQQQHMIWRTPVSHSREAYFVRVDGELLQIRQTRLIDAWRAYRQTEQIMSEHPLSRTGKTLNPPAALFARDLGSRKHGQLRADVVELLQETGHAAIVETMAGLTIGEWWALNVIRHYDPENSPAWQPALTEEDDDAGN